MNQVTKVTECQVKEFAFILPAGGAILLVMEKGLDWTIDLFPSFLKVRKIIASQGAYLPQKAAIAT